MLLIGHKIISKYYFLSSLNQYNVTKTGKNDFKMKEEMF